MKPLIFVILPLLVHGRPQGQLGDFFKQVSQGFPHLKERVSTLESHIDGQREILKEVTQGLPHLRQLSSSPDEAGHTLGFPHLKEGLSGLDPHHLGDGLRTTLEKSINTAITQVQGFLSQAHERGHGLHRHHGGMKDEDGSDSPFPIPSPTESPDEKIHLDLGSFARSGENKPEKCSNADELMYEPDGKCYKKGDWTVGMDSPCPDDFFQFQERPDKKGYGECFCSDFKGSTRPVVYWERSNRCYWLYDQGPCEVGQWLVFSNSSDPDGGERGGLTCAKRTCPENSEEDKISAFPKFWFEHQGKCYKTETADPEFCEGDQKKKIYFSDAKPEPVCLERRPSPTVKGIAGNHAFLPCRPGQKQLPGGDCKKKAQFADY